MNRRNILKALLLAPLAKLLPKAAAAPLPKPTHSSGFVGFNAPVSQTTSQSCSILTSSSPRVFHVDAETFTTADLGVIRRSQEDQSAGFLIDGSELRP